MAKGEKDSDIYVGKSVKGPDGRVMGIVSVVDGAGFEVVALTGRQRRFSWDQLLAREAEMRGAAPEPAPEPREEIHAELGSQGGVVGVVYKVDPMTGDRRLDRIIGDGRDEQVPQKYMPCPNANVCRGGQHLATLVGDVWMVECPYGRRAWTPETLDKQALPPTARPDVTLASPGGPPAPPGAKSIGWTGRR